VADAADPAADHILINCKKRCAVKSAPFFIQSMDRITRSVPDLMEICASDSEKKLLMPRVVPILNV
jgi:hypothetical protein